MAEFNLRPIFLFPRQPFLCAFQQISWRTSHDPYWPPIFPRLSSLHCMGRRARRQLSDPYRRPPLYGRELSWEIRPTGTRSETTRHVHSFRCIVRETGDDSVMERSVNYFQLFGHRKQCLGGGINFGWPLGLTRPDEIACGEYFGAVPTYASVAGRGAMWAGQT